MSSCYSPHPIVSHLKYFLPVFSQLLARHTCPVTPAPNLGIDFGQSFTQSPYPGNHCILLTSPKSGSHLRCCCFSRPSHLFPRPLSYFPNQSSSCLPHEAVLHVASGWVLQDTTGSSIISAYLSPLEGIQSSSTKK